MKQAGCLWYNIMHTWMIELRFSQHPSDPCIYVWKNEDGIILAGIHVDNYIITSCNNLGISKFKDKLCQQWTISNLGKIKFYLGIAVTCNRANKTISLSQTALIDCILDTFSMKDCYPVSTPMDHNQVLSWTPSRPFDDNNHTAFVKLPYRSLVGSLMHLAIGSYPDISLPIQKLSQFLDCYTDIHYNAALHLVHYLKETQDLSLTLSGDNPTQLLGFSDASYGMCPDTWRSTSGYCFTLGLGIVSWVARKQKTVAQSTMDAEYISALKRQFGFVLSSAVLSSHLSIHPQSLPIIMVPTSWQKILHSTTKPNTLILNSMPFANTLTMAISWLPMYPPTTTLLTSLQKPCHPNNLHTYKTL